MKKKIGYVMIAEHDLSKFHRMIEEGFKHGWQIWGSASTPVCQDRILYCQAMVKYDTHEELEIINHD